jgi:hypothetical protein
MNEFVNDVMIKFEARARMMCIIILENDTIEMTNDTVQIIDQNEQAFRVYCTTNLISIVINTIFSMNSN